jgi:hypothetical protein
MVKLSPNYDFILDLLESHEYRAALRLPRYKPVRSPSPTAFLDALKQPTSQH